MTDDVTARAVEVLRRIGLPLDKFIASDGYPGMRVRDDLEAAMLAAAALSAAGLLATPAEGESWFWSEAKPSQLYESEDECRAWWEDDLAPPVYEVSIVRVRRCEP